MRRIAEGYGSSLLVGAPLGLFVDRAVFNVLENKVRRRWGLLVG